MDGEGDTVHIHDVAVVVTNQENSGSRSRSGNGSFVTTGSKWSPTPRRSSTATPLLTSWKAPAKAWNPHSDARTSTFPQFRNNWTPGFAGTAVTHTFAAAQLDQWKGYDGTGLPEGILDTTQNRLYL